MTPFWFNIVGLGLNFLATVLLLQYSLDTKSADGITVTQGWERNFVRAFQEAIRNGQFSIILLIGGFGFQLVGTLLEKLVCP
jgi:hypothetical protein